MKILHAIHDFLPHHRAGSEIYAFQLCRELKARHDVSVLCAEYDPKREREHGSIVRRSHGGIPVLEVINEWAFADFGESYQSPRLDRVLESILDETRPDVLHVHNLLNLSMNLPALARARGIPSVATLHDYTLVCPSGGQRVHMAEQHICREIDPDRCRRCFPQTHFHAQMVSAAAARATKGGKIGAWIRKRLGNGAAAASIPQVTSADITRRLGKARTVFDSIDLFVAPSAALGEEFVRLGVPDKKLLVSDYGFVRLAMPARVPATGGRLRIGFVGTLTWHKGVHVLVEAAKHLPRDRFEMKLFGNLEWFPDYVASLRKSASGLPVKLLGPFDNEKAGEIYAQIDVLVVPSLWPENSPLVIHEAFMAGVPVVGSDQGGIPGLVAHEKCGLVYEAFSPTALAKALESLIDEPERLRRFAAAAPAVKTMDEDAREWEARYQTLVASTPTASRRR